VLVGMQYNVASGTPTTGKITYRPTVLFDLKPASDYDQTRDQTDSNCKNTSTGYTNTSTEAGDWKQNTSDTTLAANMCTESWTIGESGYSCVKVKGRLTRNMTPSETICDLTFDYFEYTIKIMIGKNGETADKVKFNEKVDFDKLRSTSGAYAYSLTLGAFVSGLLAFAF